MLTNGNTYTGAYTASAVNSAKFRIGPGIAPKASLVAYRVLGCHGGTYLTPDALERATRDGVDVVNMSLGSDLGTPDTIDSIAANAAAQSGVVIVASAGNAGPGAYMAGAPANATRVISVGAVDAAEFVADGVIAYFPGSATDVGGFNMYGSDLPVTGTHRVIMDGDSLSLGCAPEDFADVEPGDIVTVPAANAPSPTSAATRRLPAPPASSSSNNEDSTLINPVPDPEATTSPWSAPGPATPRRWSRTMASVSRCTPVTFPTKSSARWPSSARPVRRATAT